MKKENVLLSYGCMLFAFGYYYEELFGASLFCAFMSLLVSVVTLWGKKMKYPKTYLLVLAAFVLIRYADTRDNYLLILSLTSLTDTYFADESLIKGNCARTAGIFLSVILTLISGFVLYLLYFLLVYHDAVLFTELFLDGFIILIIPKMIMLFTKSRIRFKVYRGKLLLYR